ncbi:hypothetical protein AQUCO_00901000v1 [Aquilegia coerulea]|uniref:DUF668 domain-containing protein n=1 Tax=Aquilegia coerulea TaxID=218851 RepID=A0A2G5EGC5_AQUCA|nr:hypothetical protein AQUCO_00901000v1 [Aquilegia coerulea]
MVAETWFGSLWKTSRKNGPEAEKLVIGVLSFEVASLLSKVVHLWRCLGDDQVVRLRKEILSSVGIKKLVSNDDDYLDGLVCAEIIENLRFVVKSVGRIGKKCRDPVLQRFDSVFDDLMKNDADLFGWEFTSKKMDKKTKKFEKYVTAAANLYREMESLNELELVLRKMQGSSDPNCGNRLEFQKKVAWQRQDVKLLRQISLWNKTYDYVVLLLARSLVTLFRRINHVFGIQQTTVGDVNYLTTMYTDHLPRSHSISALRQMSVHPSDDNTTRFASGPLERSSTKSGPLGRSTTKSGPLGRSTTKSGPLGRSTAKSGPISRTHQMNYKQWETQFHSSDLRGKHLRSKTRRFTPVGPFKGCMMGGNKSPVLQSYAPVVSGYLSSDSVYSGSLNGTKVGYAESQARSEVFHTNIFHYSSKRKLMDAPPSTLGGAALAHHYANVIIVVEKLVESPHLIGSDARDDLYSLLPTSIKAALRARLKSYLRNLASSFYDTDLAADWNEALVKIIEWLAPLAHNMIRWQSERSFQQQHLISNTSVLLVQTLFFADQAKTEAAITELLVGLNYLWRFNKELNEKALLECTSSMEFDEYHKEQVHELRSGES